MTYGSIGDVLKNKGNYDGALEMYERRHAIEEKSLNPGHPSLAMTYGNIGDILKNKGNYAGALEMYERCHAIEEKSLDPEHPSLATTYNNIGSNEGQHNGY